MSNSYNIKEFFGDLPKNIFSGFVVSLVALPLALGLAIASDAPPISGVIASIVGGIVCSIFGGSKLTITGPGNGLVVVLLFSINSLGEGNIYQGYLFTLAAVVFSGILMFLFGLFRLGALSEFFPSSALQGMLAAIGIGILAKQAHVMIGITEIKGSTIEVLSKIPDSFLFILLNPSRENLIPAFIGIFSFFILVFYSKLRNPLFHLIPAPMWVIIFAISLFYYLEVFVLSGSGLSEDLLISLPDNLLSNLPFPDFSIITTKRFLSAVISITLIASIESLLSIKAVDKLDPEKRRSNVNKDLKALGLATFISGLIGGLNVVTVIARSSVNVNNGGSNKSSNFFHAIFLIGFVLIFQNQIEKIALPALAAILVYTGYKLAAPDNFIRILRVGKEQAAIYLITLFITIYGGIMTGIGFGIISTFVFHVIINKNFFIFSRNFFKPNVLMYLEQESGNYYISVENFCSFLNFYKLKRKIGEIPENQHAIIDFSLCDFVDHTVMEDLSDYQRTFNRKGGVFEIIGLDSHSADTQHPFAIRKSLPYSDFFSFQNNLTKRQVSLKQLASILEWRYSPENSFITSKLEAFTYFKTKTLNYEYNELSSLGNDFKIVDISYSEGAFIAKDNLLATFMLINLEYSIPKFVLDRDFLLSAFSEFSNYSEINLTRFPDFSKRFYLAGSNKSKIKTLFDSKLIFFFESHSYYRIESSGKEILIKGKSRVLSINEIKSLLSFSRELLSLLNNKYL